jgi:hypothetical protein
MSCAAVFATFLYHGSNRHPLIHCFASPDSNPIRVVSQHVVQTSALGGETNSHMYDGSYLEVLFVIAPVLLSSPQMPSVLPVERTTMSQPSSSGHLLQSSQTSASPGKAYQKAEHRHYGFLPVEAWCAYGVPFTLLETFRDNLQDDGAAFLDSIVVQEQATIANLTNETTRKKGEKGYPRASERILRTWPLYSLWSGLLLALDIDESTAVTAQDQVNAFVSSKGWNEEDSHSSLTAFIL